ncbi:MAG: IS4 family transposase [Anaerolineae bacterium]|nr:MAG: IS4 family transposase [Anaerolineae bacterium]
MQHVQPDTQVDSAHRVRADGQGNRLRVRREGPVELEPVCCHDVLPVGARPLAARDRRRTEELRGQARPLGHRGAGPLVALLRQHPPALAVVRTGLLPTLRAGLGQHQAAEEVPLQAQAGQPRLDRDRPVPVGVRLGQVPPYQGRGQAAPGARHNDYRLFAYWTESGVFFVTRMKDNAQFEVVEEHVVPQKRNILRDQTIRLTGIGAQDKCPHLLRRVEAVREDTGETLVFLTNHHGLGASTVASIYKDRWQVELFFKALKQNLKIKTFVGTSANAVKIQIWTALIAMLLLRYLQLISRFGWSLSNLVALLRMNLFTHRDLRAWLNEPFAAPPDPKTQPQAALAFA